MEAQLVPEDRQRRVEERDGDVYIGCVVWIAFGDAIKAAAWTLLKKSLLGYLYTIVALSDLAFLVTTGIIRVIMFGVMVLRWLDDPTFVWGDTGASMGARMCMVPEVAFLLAVADVHGQCSVYP
ncbi:hypothetical protein Q8F55_008655 [Vanrija albida]|uniref:Uncharacterized protein n=1 Tax=Vanrija albida TaxID=181172 RepID=A0ABR3PRQ3_9TREE